MSDLNSTNRLEHIKEVLGSSRYFYGLRRTDNGELYLGKADLMGTTDGIQVNKPGNPTENYPNFQRGQDFFEGRDDQHTKVYENLNYEQFRWDGRNLYYYMNEQGELVVRVNEPYTYPIGV
jgi:hypothetical protein